MSNESLEDQVLKAITSIRNNRGRPSLRSILNFIKHENENISDEEFKSVVHKLIQEGVIYNFPSTGKKESFYINEDNAAITNIRHPVDIDIDTINISNKDEDILLTPRKSSEIKYSERDEIRSLDFFSNPETRKPHASRNHRSIHEIDRFIEKRVTEEMSPFIEKLEDLLQSYDLLLQQRNEIISANNKLTEENIKLNMTEANAKKMEQEIIFLRNELTFKNELIQSLCFNDEENSPSQPYNSFEKTNKTSKYIPREINPLNIRNQFEPLRNDKTNNERNPCERVISGNRQEMQPRKVNMKPDGKFTQKQKTTTTCIMGDSMVKNIKPKFIRKNINRNEKVYVNSFPGANVRKMHHYAVPSLEYEPDQVILHIGTNELRSNKTTDDIANEIIDLALSMKQNNNDVKISGIIPRGDNLNDKANDVNCILKSLCYENNMDYIDNSNILPSKHISNDDLHLNIYGIQMLTKNFSNAINA